MCSCFEGKKPLKNYEIFLNKIALFDKKIGLFGSAPKFFWTAQKCIHYALGLHIYFKYKLKAIL